MAVGVGVKVGVLVGDGVLVGVGDCVTVGVSVGVGVSEGVGVLVGVRVKYTEISGGKPNTRATRNCSRMPERSACSRTLGHQLLKKGKIKGC